MCGLKVNNKSTRKTKKGVRIVCAFLVFVFCMIQFSTVSSAASIRNKKIVSVVYDDSGSMNTDNPPKWAYANYAMQSFAGMMNKEDELYITYMSQVGKRKVETVDLTSKNDSVKKIREHDGAGGTPFDAVEIAYETLKQHQDNNGNTQYWLVVMTDGQFGKKETSDVEQRLCEIADSKMPNGTSPQVIFLSMCDTSGSFTPQDGLRNNISVKSSEEAKHIMNNIAEIADKISGRYAVADTEITVIDDKTIKVKSKLPLLNIGVLTQYSTAAVTKVEFNSEESGTIESNVPLKYPEVNGRGTDTTLIGNVALLNNGGKNIPAGTYTIEFSESVVKENIKILFEPALELKLTLHKDGKKVKDVSRIPADATLDATATLYEAGTDNKIDLNLLPSGAKQTIAHLENGNVVRDAKGAELKNIKLSPNPTMIEATFELEGYFNLYQSYSFTPLDVVIDGMTAELHYDGSKRRGKDSNNVVYIDKLSENKTGIKFTLFVKGMPIDKDMATYLLPRFEKGIQTELTPIKTEVLDDGSILVYPTGGKVLPINFIYWLKYHGERNIGANMDGVSASEKVEIKPGPRMGIELWILGVILNILMRALWRNKFSKSGVDVKVTHKDLSPYDMGDVFEDEPTRVIPLSPYDRGILGFIIVLIPFPLGGFISLLPAQCDLPGGYKVVSISKNGNRLKITGLGGKNYIEADVSNRADLPINEPQDKDFVEMSVGSTIVICDGESSYTKIEL